MYHDPSNVEFSRHFFSHNLPELTFLFDQFTRIYEVIGNFIFYIVKNFLYLMLILSYFSTYSSNFYVALEMYSLSAFIF